MKSNRHSAAEENRKLFLLDFDSKIKTESVAEAIKLYLFEDCFLGYLNQT